MIPLPDPSVISELQARFMGNGCFRVVDPERRESEGIKYKKGYEARLVASSEQDLAEIQALLQKANFKCGKPFAKGYQFIQPIYGRAQVERFLSLIQMQLEVL